MKEKLISFFKEKELLVSPEALDEILKQKNPLELAQNLAEQTENFCIELTDVQKAITPEQRDTKVVVEGKSTKAAASEIESRVKVFEDFDVTGKSSSSGQVEDFVGLFNDRFERLSKILKNRGKAVRDIDTLKKKSNGGEERVIGMVSNIKVTKNGHKLVTFEDTTGTLNVLIPAGDRRLMEESQSLVPDEVLAIDGVLRKDLFIARALHFPDIPAREPRRADEEVYLAMISDTHVGSKLFLRENFKKFINWINGKEGKAKQREIASKVKYLTIAGDLVDGVGIYPGQEDELETEDIFQQYEELGELLSQIPEYIEIVAIPGNHDATRIAEPQPAIDPALLGKLVDLPNFRCIGSPGYVSLHGVEVLLYHGASIHNMVPHITSATYDKPEETIKAWLRKRHLHPIYGEKPPICPEKKDYLVMERVPDVLHVGDVHKNAYINYRGVLGVNSGTWQAITPYQIKQGHTPTPCILPVLNLQSGKLNILHFEGGAT
ncbi:MAG: DNA-directed DNA polymerase II small subunit [Candidatus Diapherotrites archaeon]|nr:DNA-directed DNA polymerase II small subunit [Candidatus Diapherotrites archaeon]